jgi:hypothetical protein
MIAARTLVRLGGTVEARLPLAKFTPRVKNAVVKALKQGYLPSRSGTGAILYDTLTDKFGLPAISFAARSRRRSATLVNIQPEMHEALSDWWKADRVAFRIANGEKWNTMLDQAKARRKFVADWPKNNPGTPLPEWYARPDESIEEPDWTEPLKYGHLSILCETDVNEFEAVGKSMQNIPDYIAKTNVAVSLIETNAVLEVQCTA